MLEPGKRPVLKLCHRSKEESYECLGSCVEQLLDDRALPIRLLAFLGISRGNTALRVVKSDWEPILRGAARQGSCDGRKAQFCLKLSKCNNLEGIFGDYRKNLTLSGTDAISFSCQQYAVGPRSEEVSKPHAKLHQEQPHMRWEYCTNWTVYQEKAGRQVFPTDWGDQGNSNWRHLSRAVGHKHEQGIEWRNPWRRIFQLFFRWFV
jgi:hypothetical protein